ncbi:MAG TPA: glucosamine-6-phosphate deaminase, partial [Sediminibacterium sp.]|nr:glucosamine-6-phosphate deaminase [Sediminibacterium sp.]
EFETISKVPRLAVTMGISSILKAKRIILLAWGNKASIVAKSVEGNVTESIPASILQQHNDCTFVIDQAASTELTRIKSPWLTGDCVWTNAMIKRAVVNLALKLNKSVLSLTSLDYTENGLSDLLVEQDDAYEKIYRYFIC